MPKAKLDATGSSCVVTIILHKLTVCQISPRIKLFRNELVRSEGRIGIHHVGAQSGIDVFRDKLPVTSTVECPTSHVAHHFLVIFLVCKSIDNGSLVSSVFHHILNIRTLSEVNVSLPASSSTCLLLVLLAEIELGLSVFLLLVNCGRCEVSQAENLLYFLTYTFLRIRTP